jgi:putative ABC transport system permease protein
VTNLQLARALERTREIAIRSALGGERSRIVRQLLVEGLLLSAAGALVGLAVAWVGVSLFNAGIAGTNPPFWIDIRIDGQVLAFVTALTVVAALISTLTPAFRATRPRANDVLKDQARGSTSRRAGVLTRVLVGGSVMLSSALLIVSGLMIKSLVEVGSARYAFATEHVLLARTEIDATRYATDDAVQALVDRLTVRLGGVPGVRQVAAANAEPLGGGRYYLFREGQTFAKPEDAPTVRRVAATPAVFDVLGLAPIDGRLLTEADVAGGERVAVVTRDVVARFFGGSRAVGERIRLGRDPHAPWWTIVGVVPQLIEAARTADVVIATAYVPLAQAPDRALTLLAATEGDPLGPAADVRRAVRDVDQDLPTFAVNSLAGRLHEQGWPFRVFGSLFLAFGIAALVMASAGLFGVLAYSVRLRTAEIGVRMALGADRGRIARMVVRQGMTVVGIGLALGVVLGAALSPLMAALFFNVTPRDPVVFGMTVGVLLATGLAASLAPALRAAAVDPLEALREG